MIHDDDLWLQRVLEPHNVSVDEDLREGAKQVEVYVLLLSLIFFVFVSMFGRVKSFTLKCFGFKRNK